MSESLPFLNLQNALPVDTSIATSQNPPTTAPGADTAFAQELKQILADLGEKFHSSEKVTENQTVTTNPVSKEGLPLVTNPVLPGSSPALLEQISSFQGNGSSSLPVADSADVFAAAKAIFGASNPTPEPILKAADGGSRLPQNGKSLPVLGQPLSINNEAGSDNEPASPVALKRAVTTVAAGLSQASVPAVNAPENSVMTVQTLQAAPPQAPSQSQANGQAQSLGSPSLAAAGSANGSGFTAAGDSSGQAPSSQPGPAPVFSQSGQHTPLPLQSFTQGVETGSDKTVADVGGRAQSLNVNLPAAVLSPAVSPASGFERPLASFTIDAPVNSPDWSGKLADQLTLLTRGNIQQAQIRLHPAHLGTLDVKLVVDEDSTSITFVSQHAAVREALDVAMPRLREMLEQQGLELADVDIFQYAESNDSPENADNTDMAASQYRDGGADQDQQVAGKASTKMSIDGLSVYA